MIAQPDILVRSPDQEVQLVMEVKSIPNATSEWAAKFRHNLLAYEAVPNAPFFVIALPERLFMWRGPAPPDVAPEFVASTSDLLNEYLGQWFTHRGRMDKESLQLVLGSWLQDLTHAIRPPRSNSEVDQMMVISGAYHAIRNGSVVSGP